MAENLTDYLLEMGSGPLLHFRDRHDPRIEIIRDLRLGEFDVLVGINLLREGLGPAGVSLVRDPSTGPRGVLRSETSLIRRSDGGAPR